MVRLRSVIAILLIAAGAIALASLSGCAQSPRETRVITDSTVEDTSTLTPLQRGKVRREVLAQVEEALEAWRVGDIDAMRPHFTDDQMKVLTATAERHKKEGTVRVHRLADSSLDVTEMTPDGREVSIRYAFINRSYTEDRDGRRIAEPTDEGSEIQIGAQKVGDVWVITRMIGGNETTQ